MTGLVRISVFFKSASRGKQTEAHLKFMKVNDKRETFGWESVAQTDEQAGSNMKMLHTSDWHLGRSLYGRKRYEEFSAFLDWLANLIPEQEIDVLLVAGDVFDTSTPSNRAQELYYRFLCQAAQSCCRHIVLIAGNHDSPSFLNAPKELLRALNVHVVGATAADPEEEVIVLDNEAGQPLAVICAVPYLRDRDIRIALPGETLAEKNAALVSGIRRHYADVCAAAERRRQMLMEKHHSSLVPIIAMGHLFSAGGKTVEGDGVRELYVGSLAHISRDVFPDVIDYLALGHLHVPQVVGQDRHIRYSGAPIPMGFGESAQEKKVVVVDWDNRTPDIREITVPCFQPLERISGSLSDIQKRIGQLHQEESRAWLEIEYTGSTFVGNLRERVEDAAAGTGMEIRRIRNRQLTERLIQKAHTDETLDDLDAGDVFQRCLDAYAVLPEDRAELTALHNEIVLSLFEDDANAG